MEGALPILLPVTFFLLLALERARPARALPRVRGWLGKGVVCFAVSGVLRTLVPAELAGGPALVRLGVVAGGVAGFLLADLCSYGLHRLLHTVPFLWRWAHQLHHSAERVDLAGAAYLHPLDVLAQVAATTVAARLLGLAPDGAALTGYLGIVAGSVQHLNVRTPQWLGWIIQRPEAHAVHHARGVHAYNYGSFMLWDILFGTLRNPATFVEPAGFWDGASREVGAMLMGRRIDT